MIAGATPTDNADPWPCGADHGTIGSKETTLAAPRQRDETVPGFYEKDGLRFAYPDNWTIDEDDQDQADAAVTVTSPQTAFWSVVYYRGKRDVQQLAACVLDALKSEYPQIEVDEADAAIDGGDACGYDLTFSYVDLLNTATIRAFQHTDGTYLVLSQAEDHELPTVEPVFEAMTASLVRDF